MNSIFVRKDIMNAIEHNSLLKKNEPELASNHMQRQLGPL